MLLPHAVILFCAPFAAVYLAVSGILLLAALLLAIWPSRRPTARRLAGGVVGSFPFLLFFQGLSLPVLVVIGAIPYLLGVWSAHTNTAIMVIAFAELGLMFAISVAASIIGWITGWGVGTRVASGMPVRDALGASWALTLVASFLTRLPPVSTPVSPLRGIAIGLGIILLIVGGVVLVRWTDVERYGSDEIPYRGEAIRLSKKYVEYDDYKNDPNNLALSEIPRVERMMTETRIGPDFADWKDFVKQVFQIKFPGYGLGPGPKVVAADREFMVEVIEIPQVAKDRYFVLEKIAGGALRLIDDFVISNDPSLGSFSAISSIRLVDDRLVYADRNAKVVRETTVPPQP
jgi:hypothetical protein